MVERERLLQMFIKVRCGTLQVAAWMALWAQQNTGHVQTCFCLYFMAGKMWLRPVSAALGQGGVTATQSGFVSGRGFSSAESPVQILAKTQESPAWSGTYCSAAYLQEPANIRTLWLRPFYLLPLSFAPYNSHHSSFLLYVHVTCLFPPPALFLNDYFHLWYHLPWF